MKISVNNYKVLPSDAFTCNLLLDGEKVAFVEYDGRGGDYLFRWVKPEVRTNVYNWVKTLPPVMAYGHKCDQDLSYVVAGAVDEFVAKKRAA